MFVCWSKVLVSMSMIGPNVVHFSNVFYMNVMVFLHSLCICVLWNTNSLCIHLILVMHFVWFGIEFTVLVLVIIY
jgi:hypothetical protein